MNTKVYKQVHDLAERLMQAAEKEDLTVFTQLYEVLGAVCIEHEGTHKDHPVQWEALADFTDDLALAVTIYEKALMKAEAINAKDYCCSIGYSMATLLLELDELDSAVAALEKAKIASDKIEDKQLKAEIHDLLTELKAS